MAFQSKKRIEPYWYTPEDQQDLDASEQPLKFKIRGLNSSEQTDVLPGYGAAGKLTPSVTRDCFRIGCTEIINAHMPNGKPCTSADAFLMLQDSFDYVIEVGNIIFVNSFNTEEEKKTSSSE